MASETAVNEFQTLLFYWIRSNSEFMEGVLIFVQITTHMNSETGIDFGCSFLNPAVHFMRLFEEVCLSKYLCGQTQGPFTSVAYLRIENKTNSSGMKDKILYCPL